MAYWGPAMSLYHQLWDRRRKPISSTAPNCWPKRARSILRPARERDYIPRSPRVLSTDPANSITNKRAEAYAKALDASTKAQSPGR